MGETRYATFPTPIGSCAIAWGPRGIVTVVLPEHDETVTRARVLRRCPDAVESEPDAGVPAIIAGIEALLSGESVSFDEARLDQARTPDFDRRVYDLTRKIPVGETLTYGEIAREVGTIGDARRVGQALGPQSLAHHRSVSSRSRGIRPHRRLLGPGRRRDEDAHPLHRGAACHGATRVVRRASARRPAPWDT